MVKRFSAAGLRQAVEEAAWTFGIFFSISFFGWMSGLASLPDKDAAEAALNAATLGGATAAGKAIIWLLTGTPRAPEQEPPA